MGIQPDEKGARGGFAGRAYLGLLCFIPLTMYLVGWCFVARQLPRGGLWAGGALCAIALVMALDLSPREDGDAPQ